MKKLRDLQDLLWERFSRDPEERMRMDGIVLATVEYLGFHINHAGEICDPRPAAPAIPRQQNARYRGGRRK